MGRSGKGYRVRWLRGACVAEVWIGTCYVSASCKPEGQGKRALEKAQRAAEDYGATEATKVQAGVRARAAMPSAMRRLAGDYLVMRAMWVARRRIGANLLKPRMDPDRRR